MVTKRARAGALALALLLHLAVLGGALAPRYERASPAAAAGAARVLTVRLLAPDASAPPLEPAAESAADATAQLAATLATPAQPAAVQAAPARPQVVPPEFQAPTLASGMEGPQVLLVPGITASFLAIRLAIGADGMVERVELGPHRYNEAEAARVHAALMQVRFHPARRHGSAVPAELALDLRVMGSLDA